MLEKTANLQHKLVLACLYYAGLRLDEARCLRWEDIDAERIHLKVAKGGKEWVVFLHDKVKGMLDAAGWRQGPLFLSNRGGIYNKRTIEVIVKEASVKAGVQKNVTPHTLRHNFTCWKTAPYSRAAFRA